MKKQNNSTVYILYRLLKLSLVFWSLLFLMIFVTKGSWAKPQGQLNPTGIAGLGITGTGGPGDNEIRSACNSALQNQSERFEWAFLQVNTTDIEVMTTTSELFLEPAIDLALAPAIDLVVCTEVDTSEEIAIKLKHPSSSSEYLQPTTADESIFHRIFSVGDTSGTYTITAVTTAGYFTRAVTVHAPQITFVDGESGEANDQFATMNDVEVHFQGFTHQNPVAVMLFRDVPALDAETVGRLEPRDFAHVASWQVPIDANGKASHRLADFIPLDPEDNVRGYYTFLACYDATCGHLPHLIFPIMNQPTDHNVRSIHWPNLLIKTMRIGLGGLSIYEYKKEIEYTQISKVSPQDATPYGTDTLLLELIHWDVTENFSLTIEIRDSVGALVHAIVDTTPPFCAFGGDEECAQWRFAEHAYRWPNGKPLSPGLHTVEVRSNIILGAIRELHQTLNIRPVFATVEQVGIPMLTIATFSGGNREYGIALQGFRANEHVDITVSSVQTGITLFHTTLIVDNLGSGIVHIVDQVDLAPGHYQVVAQGEEGSLISNTFQLD